MKKIVLTLALIGLVSVAFGDTVTKTILPGTYTNILSGASKVTAITIASTTATNSTVSFIDSGTNYTYVLPATTNITYYATNNVHSWTNYFGAVNTVTNLELAWSTNAVASTTNAYNTVVVQSALASTSAGVTGVSYYFGNGIAATNTGLGTATVTLQFSR